MDSFQWTQHFETDLPAVDKQHLQLVNMVNQFGGLLAENQVVFSHVEDLLHKLADYATFHFDEEVSLMQQVEIDERHLRHHVQAHQSFLAEVSALCTGISPNDPDSAKILLEFLIHWLVYHILGDDQNMARQIKAIEAGASPADAYERGEKDINKATEPLLLALNGLFQQVSERNRQLTLLNQSLEERVARRTKELTEANQNLETLSLTDVLTGLPNRRHAMSSLAHMWRESTTANTPLSCMMIDADYFKQVNDSHGHDAGDAVLNELARTLKYSLRTDDMVCRLGGDEFFVLCPNTDEVGGLHIAKQLHQAVSELRVPTGSDFWQGSVSIGFAAKNAAMKGQDELIKAADEGVYAAKNAGKNCVRVAWVAH